MVANIFSQAQAIAPCLIWIDEAEKLLGAEESISAQLRKYMTAVRDSGQEVWIVAATNKPWKLSEPIVRRFTNRIYVSLPDKQDALMLLRNSLRSLQQTTTTSGHHPYTLNKGVLGEKLDQLMGKYCSQPQQRYLSCDDVVRSVETIPRALLEELKKSGARPRPFKKVGPDALCQVSTFAKMFVSKLYVACNTFQLART